MTDQYIPIARRMNYIYVYKFNLNLSDVSPGRVRDFAGDQATADQVTTTAAVLASCRALCRSRFGHRQPRCRSADVRTCSDTERCGELLHVASRASRARARVQAPSIKADAPSIEAAAGDRAFASRLRSVAIRIRSGLVSGLRIGDQTPAATIDGPTHKARRPCSCVRCVSDEARNDPARRTAHRGDRHAVGRVGPSVVVEQTPRGDSNLCAGAGGGGPSLTTDFHVRKEALLTGGDS